MEMTSNNKHGLSALLDQYLCFLHHANFCMRFTRTGNDNDHFSSISLTFGLKLLFNISYCIVSSNSSRDYETLNHQMLQSLIDKVNGMQGNKQLLCDDDSDVDWSLWVDDDLPEDDLEDLDYMLPEHVGEASITTSVSRDYNLRNRRL